MPVSPVLAMTTLAQMNPTTLPGGGGPPTVGPSPAAPAVPAAGVPAPGPAAAQVAPGQAAAPVNQQAPSTQGSSAASQPAPKQPGSPLDSFIFPIVIMFILLFLFLRRGQGKEEKRRKALLAEMKKGDKVQTVGGLIARVVAIDDDDVTLKIDESANVRAVYKKSAILNVIVPPDEKTK